MLAQSQSFTFDGISARPIAPAAASMLTDANTSRCLSGRADDRVLRLARTVADLAACERIGEAHVAEALQLQRKDYT